MYTPKQLAILRLFTAGEMLNPETAKSVAEAFDAEDARRINNLSNDWAPAIGLGVFLAIGLFSWIFSL